MDHMFDVGDSVVVLTEEEMLKDNRCRIGSYGVIRHLNNPRGHGFVEDMKRFSGRVFTIAEVQLFNGEYAYRLSSDRVIPYTWQDFMLKPAGETRLLEPASDDEIMSLFE